MTADEIRETQWKEHIAPDYPQYWKLPSVNVEIAAQLAELNATLKKALIERPGLKEVSIFERVFGD